jgi:uncharacterized delta-60 repeat protein
MWPLSSRKSRPSASARPRSFRPRLEALEDRVVPSAPGTLDTSFGSGGIVTTGFGKSTNDTGLAVAVQPDGKIVEAGFSTKIGGANSFDLVRYNPNGTLDTTFGTGGEVQTKFPANSIGGFGVGGSDRLLVQPDGKILVEGIVSGNLELIRYNPNGTLDTTFNGTGMVSTAFPYGGLANPAGMRLESVNGVLKIVAAAEASINGQSAPAVARYNLDGSLDTSFGSGGEVVTNLGSDVTMQAMAIEPNGEIVLAGENLTATGSGSGQAVVRYDLSGNLDTTFGNGGVAINSALGIAHAVIVQPDGKIVTGGLSASGGHWSLERLNSDGSLDTTFGTGGDVISPFGGNIWALGLQTNGRIVASGNNGSSAGFGVARFNPDGSVDTTFGTGGEVTTAVNGGGLAVGLAVQADGKIVAAGSAPNSTKINSTPEFFLVRYWGDPVS